MPKYNNWTPEQILILTETEGEFTAEELAEQLSKTKYMVNKKATELGINLLKRVRIKAGNVYYQGAPCLIFMSVEQICRSGGEMFEVKKER
jgi:hypothetical protein